VKAPQQEAMKAKAFDLLDALTRSGALLLKDTSLHVLVATTHRFDQSLVDTVSLSNCSVNIQGTFMKHSGNMQ
jgi:hypothetical protein